MGTLPITNQIRRLRFDHHEMTQQELAEAQQKEPVEVKYSVGDGKSGIVPKLPGPVRCPRRGSRRTTLEQSAT